MAVRTSSLHNYTLKTQLCAHAEGEETTHHYTIILSKPYKVKGAAPQIYAIYVRGD